MNDSVHNDPPGRVEEIEISGDKLLATVRQLIAQGNMRRVIVCKPDVTTLFDLPLTVGAGISALLALLLPLPAALAAAVALAAKLRVVIVRDVPPPAGPAPGG
jgi:hypothetical protein